jgi:hypothetical protein
MCENSGKAFIPGVGGDTNDGDWMELENHRIEPSLNGALTRAFPKCLSAAYPPLDTLKKYRGVSDDSYGNGRYQ